MLAYLIISLLYVSTVSASDQKNVTDANTRQPICVLVVNNNLIEKQAHFIKISRNDTYHNIYKMVKNHTNRPGNLLCAFITDDMNNPINIVNNSENIPPAGIFNKTNPNPILLYQPY